MAANVLLSTHAGLVLDEGYSVMVRSTDWGDRAADLSIYKEDPAFWNQSSCFSSLSIGKGNPTSP